MLRRGGIVNGGNDKYLRHYSTTSVASGLVSANCFAGDLKLWLLRLSQKVRMVSAWHSVNVVLIGSPQRHHGGCVFGRSCTLLLCCCFCGHLHEPMQPARQQHYSLIFFPSSTHFVSHREVMAVDVVALITSLRQFSPPAVRFFLFHEALYLLLP